MREGTIQMVSRRFLFPSYHRQPSRLHVLPFRRDSDAERTHSSAACGQLLQHPPPSLRLRWCVSSVVTEAAPALSAAPSMTLTVTLTATAATSSISATCQYFHSVRLISVCSTPNCFDWLRLIAGQCFWRPCCSSFSFFSPLKSSQICWHDANLLLVWCRYYCHSPGS